MRLCKIKLTRVFSVHSNYTRCKNIFPNGHHRDNVAIVAYEEYALVEGNNIGYCIGTVADSFTFTDDVVEITRAEGDVFIEEVAALQELPEHQVKFDNIKKQILTDAGIV